MHFNDLGGPSAYENNGIIKQVSNYYPELFCCRDYNKDPDLLTDALWYADIRSVFEDTKMLLKSS